MLTAARVLLLSLLSILFTSPSHAQDSNRVERTAYVLGASLGYALVDYYGFNLVRKYDAPRWAFHVVKSLIQAGISYLLYEKFGLSSAISFNLIWWTWGDDIAYYGWSYLLNSFPWEGRTENGFRFKEYSWAGWTPMGLLRPQGSSIARDALIGQAVVGLSVSLAILLY